MLDQRRVAAQPDENRERLFTARYRDLLVWALRLTNQDRAAAEDLVQDAFVQFVLGRSKLEAIENIDGYLRRMLRYMHRLRISRSAQHLHETALSLADYDSLRLGWTAIEPPRRMQASEELYQICAYACSRKESSKTGSVLILRFFHEYLPSEIARVLNSSRNCVDQWQRVARREAKLFMNRPGRLRFVNAKAPAGPQTVQNVRSDSDLMHELRQMIFNSRQGDCISREELEQAYKDAKADGLSTTKLAHIVSCAVCLDTVNSLLGLPPLAERYQTETHEPKDPPGDAGSGPPSGGAEAITRKFESKLRETHEHKPHELRIAVNGFLIGSLKVSSELSELNLNLTPDEPVEFVEVSSEQGVQLLFLTLNPTAPQDEQWAWIELSDGRSLEACFRDDNGPSLHVIYRDPEPEESYSAGESLNTDMSSPLFVVPAGNGLAEQKVADQSVVFHLRSWTRQLIERLRSVLRRPVVAQENGLSNDEPVPLFTVLSQSHYTTRRRSWRWLMVLISAVVVGAFLYVKSNLSPTVTASMLLEKAITAEENTAATPDLVRHRFVNLEERRSAEGAIVARRTIETWESRVNGDLAQRLYDDSNRLIAGVRQTGDGSRTVYHHGLKPQTQPLTTPESLLLNLEDTWQLEPSARSFSALIAEASMAEVEERATTYVLRYEKDRAIGASHLLKATLTVSKSDFHAIEQTLLVQRGNELREYRFTEASFELVPFKAVAPSAFEVEPELTGGAGKTGGPGDWAIRDLTSSRVPPSPSTSTPPAASAELEVDVAYLLNQAKADRNEQVALTRSAGGSLRVEGVVDSQQRKEEFLRALSPIVGNPAVKIEIRTVAETIQRATVAGSAVRVQDTEETSDTIAVEKELRAYFSKRSAAGSIDQTIQSYSSRVVNRAYRALFHAIELKRLVERFANIDMRTVSPDARAKWLTMLREHATAFARENAALRDEIQPVFFPATVLQDDENALIQSDADLARMVQRLHKLALSNNEAIRSAFTISAQSSASSFKSAGFWQSLRRAGNLADRIERY